MRSEDDPYAAVVRALARRDLTSTELDERLARAGFADAARVAALDRARDAGYVDDDRVARERARRLCERGWSNAGIRSDLEQRGVEEDAIETIVAGLEDEGERVLRRVTKLGPGPRTAQTLTRKGFPRELIDLALDRAIAEGP